MHPRPAAPLVSYGRAAAALCLGAVLTAQAGPPLKLHVPSPDWRDQVIYFLMTDRFDDGDPANNDLGVGEFDPADASKYNGGDLKGVTRRVDYLRGLGATAVWITPPVANQWVDPLTRYTGYHGYWAEHFMKVDRHLGSLADYRQLSHTLHSAGMYLVQDIVLNHTGNFFGYDGTWTAEDPTRGLSFNVASRPSAAPTQQPFNLNDPRDPAQRRAGIYHWTPNVTDFADKNQELNFQMSGLDDLNTENPAVRRALRRSYGHWIREVGVDAFRVDTAFYVPPEYFSDFMQAQDPAYPGMAQVALQTGRRSFHVFGEGFGIDKPFDDAQARKIERYMTGADGRPLMPGMLNFPLYGALGDTFARGRPPAELAYRIDSMMKLHARPHLMPTFVDNHDVDRFLAGGSVAGLKQALLAMFTLPGIPTLYYGTEQTFSESRAAMFKAGFGAGGRDRFDTSAPLYRYIADLAALRRQHRLFSRGVPTMLKANTAAAGALAWRMTAGDGSAFVLLNSAESDTLLDNLDTGLPAGTVLQALFGIDGKPADVIVGAEGRLSMKLHARSGFVFKATERRMAPVPLPPAITLDALADARAAGDFSVGGSVPAGVPLQLVVDGDLARARTVLPSADGRWQARVDTSRMVDAATTHGVVAWSEPTGAASVARSFRVERAWQMLADLADPAGDDAGPLGRYSYPTEVSYASQRQMDLRRVQVSGSGGALRIDLTMNQVSTPWNPPNGFDHVAFTIFIEVPGRDGGATAMPFQNAALPAGMRWHYRLRAHGWSNALFASDGAAAAADGRLVTPAASIEADAARKTVSFTLPAASLGGLASLSGVKIYVTTWDYDAGYRALTPLPQNWSVGGGNPAIDPLVMDDSVVITLP